MCLYQFLQASGAQISSDWGRFSIELPHNVIQTDKDVTKNAGILFNILCLYQFLQASGCQISSDWDRFSIELAP
jgi:hypothetical protein